MSVIPPRRRSLGSALARLTVLVLATSPTALAGEDDEQHHGASESRAGSEAAKRQSTGESRAGSGSDRRELDEESRAGSGSKREGATMSRGEDPEGEDKQKDEGDEPSEAGDEPAEAETYALPSGDDKSGVTSQAISIPKGSGSIQGMEESFSAQLSTGIATFTVPFLLPKARGGASPSLSLSYSSAAGTGPAGQGWSVGVPFIARQTDRGLPKYDDRSSWHPEQDRFVFNGGQELVPICTVGAGGECPGKLTVAKDGVSTDEVMPEWASGWQYFRPRVEGSFLRFFWSPDHLTWIVHDKSGTTMEIGAPAPSNGPAAGGAVGPNASPSTSPRKALIS